MTKIFPIVAFALIFSVVLGVINILSAQDAPWEEMDYGPFLSAAIEVTPDNIACKGVAIPLTDDGSRAVLFDTAELRWAAAWEGEFVELRGIVYDGPHGTWPRISGDPIWTNPQGPGVVAQGQSFEDPRKVPYGPLPVGGGRWKGLQRDLSGILLHYSIGAADIFERPLHLNGEEIEVWKRSIHCKNLKGGLQFSLMEAEEGAKLSEVRLVPNEVNKSESLLELSDGRKFLIDLKSSKSTNNSAKLLLRSGRLILEVTSAGDDEIYTHLHLSKFENSDSVQQFRSVVNRRYFRDPSPLGEIWGQGSKAIFEEEIELNGKLAVNPDSEEESEYMVIPAGTEIVERDIDLFSGETVRLYGMEGSVLSEEITENPIESSVLVFRGKSKSYLKLIAGWNCDESSGELMENIVDAEKDLNLEGVTWRRGVRGRALDFDGTSRAIWTRHDNFEFYTHGLTFGAWVCTTKDGSIFSQTRSDGPWMEGGKAFFIRDGRLCFDIGWVGAVSGNREVTDGRWHHVAFSWNPWTRQVRLFLDGTEDGEGMLELEGPIEDAVIQIGFTADNFPEEPYFSGYIDGIRMYAKADADESDVMAIAAESGEPLVRSVAVTGLNEARFKLVSGEDIGVRLVVQQSLADQKGTLYEWSGPVSRLPEFIDSLQEEGVTSESPFEIDQITWPEDNPWDSWMRFGDFDFLDNGKSAAISTWNGDVWRVDGITEGLEKLSWRRIASGLSQPLGLLTREKTGGQEQILVLGRDQITELVDVNGDYETDIYRAFNVDAMNSPHFHEPAGGLQEGVDGKVYYLKAARHAKLPTHPQHGTLIQVDGDGSSSRVVASGFRAPNGLAVDQDGIAWGSDQEGHWTPANRINRITEGSFHGNNWSGSMLNAKELRTTYEPPLCWIHPSVDRSPAAQVRVPEGIWGDLSGKLLGLSYGTGEVYLILEDEVDGQYQGGIVPLPIGTPTGTMRGRFNEDGSLYLSGLFGWSSDKTNPGGFYRVRRTESPLPIPISIKPQQSGLKIKFSEKITTKPENLLEAFNLEGWNYRWSSNYGSPKLDLVTGEEGTTRLNIASVKLSNDGREVQLVIPEMMPAMQMHLDWSLSFEELGQKESYIHFTVHTLAKRPND